MYCNHCGAPLGQDQLACPSCGRSVADVRSSIANRARVAGHLHLLAIFWFVMAAFWMIPMAVMFALGAAAGAAPGNMPPQARVFAPIFFFGLGILFLAIAVVRAVTAYGLLKVRSWGRVLALVMGFLMLLDLPFGTALGIYTLWVLLPAEAGEEYLRISASREGGYQQHAQAQA